MKEGMDVMAPTGVGRGSQIFDTSTDFWGKKNKIQKRR
jgi:hypothetical protein